MTKTMKAAVVREFGKPLTIEEVPVPEPGPGEIQVGIRASGVCHTDLHAAEGDWPVKPTPPFIPGHEGVGFVSGVGKGVLHVKEGDRVGVPWLYTACGHCRHCLGGWETLCESQKNTGYSVNGGFADYVVADPNFVGHLPANLGFIERGPVLCAGVTVYKGLKVTDAKPGDWDNYVYRCGKTAAIPRCKYSRQRNPALYIYGGYFWPLCAGAAADRLDLPEGALLIFKTRLWCGFYR